MTEPIHKGKDLPPVWVVHAASGGDSEAMEQVLRYYDDYMSRLCTRTRKLRCPVPPVTRNDFITTVGVRTDNRRSENSEISDALCRFHHFFIINHTEGVSLKGV